MDDDAAADMEYYLGTFCANHGGEIRLNLFSDDTCTTLAECNGGQTRGAKCYTAETGITIPYTQSSIVDDPCVPCSENYADIEAATESGVDLEDGYDFGYARESCATLYDKSGKCEKYMQGGVYTYGCSYIKGIQIGTSSDGYAVAVKRSLGADAAMGTFVIALTFIGMYIYYLRHLVKKLDAQKSKNEFYVPSTALS